MRFAWWVVSRVRPWLAALMVAASGVTGAEPLFPPTGLIPDGEVKLRVVLIAADAPDVARWMLECDGTDGALERRLLDEAGKGRATEVTRVTAGGGRTIIKAEAPKKIRVIGQNDAAHLWQDEWYAKQEGKTLADPEKMLEFNTQHPIGPELEADVPVIPDHPAATVRVKFSYTPEPEERPTTTWPLATLRAPRVILRPWSVNVQCRMPLGKPVLFAAQMEAPAEGKVNTGKVWLALGQLDVARDQLSEPGLRKSIPVTVESDAMAWVFSVPNDKVAAWLAKRVDSSGDAATLREWIEASSASEGPALAGVMHMRQEAGQNAEVVSRRFWEDGSGFEPGAEGPDYRTLPESDQEYELKHEFAGEIALEGVPGSNTFGPVATSSPSRRMEASVKFALPPHAARWLHVQSAMEKVTGDDPAGMELAAVGYEHSKAHAMMRHGDVAMVTAWPQANGTHTRVAFMRLLRSDASAVPSRAGGANPLLNGTNTLWIVDTEVSPWLARLASPACMDDTGLSERVMEETRAGKARVAGVLLRQMGEWTEGGGGSAEGEGILVNYLNTHPYAGGIPFNPRYFRAQGPGMQWSWSTKAESNGAQTRLQLKAATAATGQRRWGVKLAHDAQRTPENSGVDLPVRNEFRVDSERIVPWNKPVVMGVVQHGKGEAARLRWVIAHTTAAEGVTVQPIPNPEPFLAQSYQASLIAVSPVDAARMPAAVSNLVAMHAAREMHLIDLLLAGKARLVDFVGVTTDGRVSPLAGAANGLDPFSPEARSVGSAAVSASEVMDYLEPRGLKERPARLDEYGAVPHEPPPGTLFNSQINLEEHRRGFEMLLGTKLAIAHGGPIEVVTDTLPGWYEFPRLRTEEQAKAGPEKVMVSVQRPVFFSHRSEDEWPGKGRAMVIPWSGAPPPKGEVWFVLLRRQLGDAGAK